MRFPLYATVRNVWLLSPDFIIFYAYVTCGCRGRSGMAEVTTTQVETYYE